MEIHNSNCRSTLIRSIEEKSAARDELVDRIRRHNLDLEVLQRSIASDNEELQAVMRAQRDGTRHVIELPVAPTVPVVEMSFEDCVDYLKAVCGVPWVIKRPNDPSPDADPSWDSRFDRPIFGNCVDCQSYGHIGDYCQAGHGIVCNQPFRICTAPDGTIVNPLVVNTAFANTESELNQLSNAWRPAPQGDENVVVALEFALEYVEHTLVGSVFKVLGKHLLANKALGNT